MPALRNEMVVAGVAHDLSNLLTVMLGTIDGLSRAPTHSNDGLQVLRQATESAVHLVRLLRAPTAAEASQPEHVELGELVHSLTPLLGRLATPSVVEARCPEQGLWVWADADELTRVLVNLALNARDAMPAGGSVVLTAGKGHPPVPLRGWAPSSVAWVAVRDHGGGLPPEVAGRAFEPGCSTKGPNRGMGLPVCREILRRHGGELEVARHPGTGACLVLLLPLEREH